MRGLGRVGMLAVAVAVVALAASCSIPLGDLGGPSSIAVDINEAGVIVGASEVPGSTLQALVQHGFKRLPDATLIDLGVLPGGISSVAVAINESGVIAGTATVPTADPAQPASHAVMWDASGAIHDLGSIGTTNAEVRGLDDLGRIVGFRDEAPGGPTEAFVFDPAVGHIAPLPDVPGGGGSLAFGMNDVGDVVGYQWVGSMAHPVRWDLDAGTATDLSATWGVGLLSGINDAGTMVGQVRIAGTPPQSSMVVAAILRPGESAPTPLGTGSFSAPYWINDDEVVVGRRTDLPQGGRAFRWTASTGPVSLTTDEDSMAIHVNERGQIVGMADSHAALLVAPS